jgi:hypothetical protein
MACTYSSGRRVCTVSMRRCCCSCHRRIIVLPHRVAALGGAPCLCSHVKQAESHLIGCDTQCFANICNVGHRHECRCGAHKEINVVVGGHHTPVLRRDGPLRANQTLHGCLMTMLDYNVWRALNVCMLGRHETPCKSGKAAAPATVCRELRARTSMLLNRRENSRLCRCRRPCALRSPGASRLAQHQSGQW